MFNTYDIKPAFDSLFLHCMQEGSSLEPSYCSRFIPYWNLNTMVHKSAPSLLFLGLKWARNLNICDTRQPPIYLWNSFHNNNEANVEPKNVDKANSTVGAGTTGLKPTSAYPHLSHVASKRNISAYSLVDTISRQIMTSIQTELLHPRFIFPTSDPAS